jgi:methylmalonyl-CoA/ethylmalonyl-CoA epimerase
MRHKNRRQAACGSIRAQENHVSTPATAPAISHIGQIAIIVKDVGRAIGFYQNTLGFPMMFRAGNLALFMCGQTRLMLDGAAEAEFDHPGSILYFSVPDINAAYQQMKSCGAEFRDQPHMIARMPDHELWMTFFKDTEGDTLALMSEVR